MGKTAQLGNYIHWRYRNYKTSGTSYNGNNKPPSPSVLVNNLKKDIMTFAKVNTPIPKATLQQIANRLNVYYGENYNNVQGLSAEQRQQIINAFINYIEQQGHNLSNINIDASNLSAIKVVGKGKSSSATKGKLLSETGKTYLDAIYRRIQLLHERVNQGMVANSDIVNQINNLDKQFTTIFSNAQDMIDKINGNSGQVLNIPIQFPPYSEQQNFVSQLNNLLFITSIADDKQTMGLLAEYMTAVMMEFVENNLQENFQEFIDNIPNILNSGKIVGHNRVANIVDIERVYGATQGTRKSVSNKGATINWSSIGKDGKRIDYKYVQDKVDVQVELPSLLNIQLPASIKNIGSKSNLIHLLKGSSLIKYLQLYPDFGNHYLNITANIGRSKKDDLKVAEADLALMHQGMLMALGTHALAGGLLRVSQSGSVYRAGGAEILVLNRRGAMSGEFQVYDVGSIVQELLNDPANLLVVNGDLNASTPKQWLNPYIFTGRRFTIAGAGYLRCLKILQQLHSAQLEVSLKTFALK